MKLYRCFPALCALAAVAAGCGESPQGPAQRLGILPQGAPAPSSLHRPFRGDLIYAAYGNVVYLFAYRTGSFVDRFKVDAIAITGLCAGTNGNVFVTSFSVPYGLGYVYEYAHGGAKPIKTFGVSAGYAPFGCSQDAATGNLAVAVDAPGSGDEEVAVFKKLHRVATYYKNSKFFDLRSVTYDSEGNLFAQAVNSKVFELLRGHTSFVELTLPRSVRGAEWLQWDGSSLAIMYGKLPHVRIARVRVVGSTGKLQGTVSFAEIARESAPPPTFWVQGSEVLLSMGVKDGTYRFGMYPYPAGQGPKTVVRGYEIAYFTVSLYQRTGTSPSFQ
jgi:hypothetical protein